MKIFLFLCMLFLHVVDDFGLQGCLANLKQKEFWVKNAPDPLYKHDYVMALIMHSISWTFMIMLPIMYHMNFHLTLDFLGSFVGTAYVHAWVDDMKANRHKINLIVDQTIHVVQIVCMALIYLV